MAISVRTRLQQIGWQLDLIRVDAVGAPEGFAQKVYDAEGEIAKALALLGDRPRHLPPPHRYQERTPAP
jgi:hypothetical protein